MRTVVPLLLTLCNKPTLKMNSGKSQSKSELFYDGKWGSPLLIIARTKRNEILGLVGKFQVNDYH